MAEIGQVTAVIGDEVVVRLVRKEACAKCGACSAGLSAKDMIIQAQNKCHAEKDQWVEIELNEVHFIRAVAIMYVIPLAGLLVGIGAGYGIGSLVLPNAVELIAVLGGFLFSALTFGLIHKREPAFKRAQYKPKAVRITNSIGCAENSCSE